jgi:hypothetical protein
VELLPVGRALGSRDAGEQRLPEAVLQRIQVHARRPPFLFNTHS